MPRSNEQFVFGVKKHEYIIQRLNMYNTKTEELTTDIIWEDFQSQDLTEYSMALLKTFLLFYYPWKEAHNSMSLSEVDNFLLVLLNRHFMLAEV